MEINLDAKAFGTEVPTETDTAQTPPVESVENKEQETSPSTGDETEQRVPYSRFKIANDRARQAEQEAESARIELERIRQERTERYEERTQDEPKDLPSYWLKMYGDSDNSREAYKYELERQTIIRDEARREALDAVREERQMETRALSNNERTIDQRIANLSDDLGRDLTDTEESALLDIVDEYTPKDQDGNYAGELIPFEKAWEIYEMKQSQGGQRTRQARSTPTALTSSRTDGEPNNQEKNNKDWNPLDWNSWRKKIPQ